MAPGGGRDFNCSWEDCGKSFNRKSDLCRHYRIHTNERPYHCTVKDCNKSFIQRSALTVHSRTHTGEKPHVCDHDGCHKAFSDSSSLARHRRIHTGKRPYICQEPTCERTFCRKTTLTKHQYRSHPPVSTNRQSSEDATSDQSYQPPAPASLANDRYLLAQQPFYSQPSNPSHEFYPRNIPITQVTMQEAPAVVLQSIPINPVADMQHAQQMQLMQRLEQNRPAYAISEYAPHPLAAQYMASPPLVSHYSDSQYKPPARLLNQHEGTNWGFLGVG